MTASFAPAMKGGERSSDVFRQRAAESALSKWSKGEGDLVSKIKWLATQC